jgi:hypothetical protein
MHPHCCEECEAALAAMLPMIHDRVGEEDDDV